MTALQLPVAVTAALLALGSAADAGPHGSDAIMVLSSDQADAAAADDAGPQG